MNRILILFLFFLWLPLEANTSSEALRVGMELSYPPFEMACPNGMPCGVSVAIAKALGDYLKRPVAIENTSFIGLIPSLNSNKIDLIISSLTVTPRREKVIDFSIPYATTGLCLLLNINSTIETIDQANAPDKVIAVKSGTTGEVYATTYLHQAKVRVFDRESLCVLEVVQGKADAFIYDQLSVYTNWKKNPQKLKALLKPFHKEYWAVGIKKGNQELLKQVNAFITTFRQEGGFDKIADHYLREQQQAFKQLNIPFIF